MNTHLQCLLLAAGLVFGGATSLAQTAASDVPDDLRAAIENLRSDVNAFKIRVLNEALQMTGSEAEKFWPIYRQYEHDLANVANQKIALLREFHGRCASGTLDNADASRLAQRWLKNVQARLDLWKKYQKRIAKAVSPARAAQFLQVEHQMALFMDLNIAADMPALGRVIKAQ